MSDLIPGRFTPDGTHRADFRIYYEDTDAAGVVYYANYLKLAERARTEALRACGVSQGEMLAAGQGGFVVRRCSIDFRASALLDDVVTVESELTALSRVRLAMRQHLRRREETLAVVEVEIVMVDARKKPVRIPEAMMQAFSRFHLIPEQSNGTR